MPLKNSDLIAIPTPATVATMLLTVETTRPDPAEERMWDLARRFDEEPSPLSSDPLEAFMNGSAIFLRVSPYSPL